MVSSEVREMVEQAMKNREIDPEVARLINYYRNSRAKMAA